MNNDSREKDPEYWKAKYLRLLDKDEQLQLEREQEEALLIKAVTRLTLLAEGLDKALDPHLRSIRELVRSDKRGPALRQKVDQLLETLIRTPESERPQPASVGLTVIRFLETLNLEHGRQKPLQQLRQRVESGQCTTEAELFAAAATLLNEAGPDPQASASGLMGKLLGRGQRAAAALEPKQLRKHLADLLTALRVPLSLEERRRQMLVAVQDADRDILELIDATADLVAALGQEADKEHSQLKDFLATLSGKLVDLEAKTLGMGALAEDSTRSRIAADQAVSGQVEDIRAVALAATDLTQLQTVMASRLDGIAEHLEANRQAEEIRFAETQQRVRELAERMQAMEQESLDLRTQLTLANDLAFTDALTRLPNRAAYEDRVALEEMRWKRFNYPISLLIWDIDHFKSVNDRFGHPAGDKALQVIAEVLQGAIRGTDFLARLGGEEFVMLLTGTDSAHALEVADGIRVKVEQCGFTSEGRPITITVSCGIAEFTAPGGHQQAYARADQALYQAKGGGRNRCVIAE